MGWVVGTRDVKAVAAHKNSQHLSQSSRVYWAISISGNIPLNQSPRHSHRWRSWRGVLMLKRVGLIVGKVGGAWLNQGR
jgi:hypothetical protein